MQVLAILAIVVVSAAGKGSGPYLPSGWRPSGPAFYLPNEVQKPAENLQDVILGSEASGSDALREYGPPKLEISVNQALPDVAIEQNFVDAAVSSGEEVSSIVLGRVVEESTGVAVEESSENAEQPTTEGQINVEVVYETTPEIIVEKSNGEILAEIEETVIPATESVAIVPVTESVDAPQETTTEDAVDVRNIQLGELSHLEVIVPEVLASLEEAIKTEIEINQQVADSSSQETSGSSEQVPEGFLEYGPPGFKEYGPPKEDLNTVAIQGLLSQASVETNEARRRRFSPKFKPVKKLH
ncbi:uncharacterized protein LOC121738051 [Aricia agestis]|uniref:uncharacterized protein LOC121738051 n=1 Tax=Aricia agestis TaxID=91739 RepID=UPI001C207C4A|nr:uncharacterized protein LOC121738051 [Aricia agestis]